MPVTAVLRDLNKLNTFVRVAQCQSFTKAAAELRTDPQRYVGQSLRWTLQYIALQQADELRPEIPAGGMYLLMRGPLPERGFVYLVIPEPKRSLVAALAPLLTPQTQVLVKGSRGMKLERVVEQIREGS